MTTIYVTKWALTQGISTEETDSNINEDMVAVKSKQGHTNYFHRNEWHTTISKAAVRAEEMRLAKIVSLKKSLARMESLAFIVSGSFDSEGR